MRFYFLSVVLFALLASCENDSKPLTDFDRIQGVPSTLMSVNAIDVVREAVLYAQADSALQVPEAAYYLKQGTLFEKRSVLPDSTEAFNAFFTLSNCLGDDGRLRNGNIQLFGFNEWTQDSAFFLFQLSLEVNNEKVNALGRIDFAGLSADSVKNWNITQAVFSVTESGVSYTLLPTLNLALDTGDSLNWIDTNSAGKVEQRFLLTGNFKISDSSKSYSIGADSGIVYGASCPYPTEGTLQVNEPNRALVVVRMNPSCSATQTYTIGNNIEGTIQLK